MNSHTNNIWNNFDTIYCTWNSRNATVLISHEVSFPNVYIFLEKDSQRMLVIFKHCHTYLFSILTHNACKFGDKSAEIDTQINFIQLRQYRFTVIFFAEVFPTR